MDVVVDSRTGTISLADADDLRHFAVRTLVPPGREAEFASMLDTAATSGWVAADGSIRAHVTWDGVS